MKGSTRAAPVFHSSCPDPECHSRYTHCELRSGNLGDDDKGGEANPLLYSNDCGVAVYVEDALFFLEESNRFGKPNGCLLDFDKIHNMTSTNGT